MKFLAAPVLLVVLPMLAGAAEHTGIVHARHQLALSVAAPGLVSAVPAQPGRRVQAGAVLIQLDDRLQVLEEQRRRIVMEDASELRATEERLKLVQPLAEDARRLAATKGALSREDLARAELDLLTTRGRLRQLEAQEEREKSELAGAQQERVQRRLVAPVAGVITKVGIDVGEWARPGDALVELVDASVLQLRLNVPAAAARALKEGATLEVSFEAALQLPPVQGKLVFVSPAVDASSGLVALRVQFDNPGGKIPPGIKGVIRL